MNAIFNENELAAIETSTYWSYDFDSDATDRKLTVRRFGNWSLLTVEYDDGESNSVLVHNGKAVYWWEADADETPAPVQALNELSDRNSKFYQWYLEAVWPYSAAKGEADELHSLVVNEEG